MTSIKKLKEELEKLKPCVNSYGQVPTLTKSNAEEFINYISCQAKISEHESVMEDIEKSLIADGKFTTSLNRKVCYEAGKRETLERVDKFIKELKDLFDCDLESEIHMSNHFIKTGIDKLAGDKLI